MNLKMSDRFIELKQPADWLIGAKFQRLCCQSGNKACKATTCLYQVSENKNINTLSSLGSLLLSSLIMHFFSFLIITDQPISWLHAVYMRPWLKHWRCFKFVCNDKCNKIFVLLLFVIKVTIVTTKHVQKTFESTRRSLHTQHMRIWFRNFFSKPMKNANVYFSH